MGSGLSCHIAYLGASAPVLDINAGSWHHLLCVAVWGFHALVCVQMFMAGVPGDWLGGWVVVWFIQEISLQGTPQQTS